MNKYRNLPFIGEILECPMKSFDQDLRQIIHFSLAAPPEELLTKCLEICIATAGANGGSILGEEGPYLQFLQADSENLIGRTVPWDSIAGTTATNGRIIYTYAPADKRHFGGIDAALKTQTRYLLSIPIPAIHSTAAPEAEQTVKSAGVLQLLFNENVFAEIDVSQSAREFELDFIRERTTATGSLDRILMILPNLAFALEIIKQRRTSYQIIHELKNKLISAQSWLNCLQEDLDDTFPNWNESPDLEEDIDLARSATADGAVLAKNYLQFTKLYSTNFEETNINNLLRETAQSIRAFDAQQRGLEGILTVETKLDTDLPPRNLDPAQLRMALFNLGKNAAEAICESETQNPTITLTSELLESGKLQIAFQDNGPGMPPEIADNLFVPFKTKKEGGTGLGLAITKKIIDIHNGTIRCSTGDKGTTFTVTI